jgi:hypothetical protein
VHQQACDALHAERAKFAKDTQRDDTSLRTQQQLWKEVAQRMKVEVRPRRAELKVETRRVEEWAVM